MTPYRSQSILLLLWFVWEEIGPYVVWLMGMSDKWWAKGCVFLSFTLVALCIIGMPSNIRIMSEGKRMLTTCVVGIASGAGLLSVSWVGYGATMVVSQDERWSTIVMSCVTAPLLEEPLFRWAWVRSYPTCGQTIMSCMCSSVAFAYSHECQWQAMCVLLVMGILLSGMRVFGASLFDCVVAHSMAALIIVVW